MSEEKPAPLSPAETVALCDALKADRKEAAAELSDGFGGAVDFTVRIVGQVSKGLSTPPSTGTAAAIVDLYSPAVVSALLKKLKVDEKKLRNALRAIGRKAEKDGAAAISSDTVAGCDTLEEVFSEVAAELVEKLPQRPVVSNGRQGAVSAKATATRV